VREARKYYPIWDTLKAKHKVVLAVPKQEQQRVKKGVLKEKDNDLGYKILLAENSQRAKLKVSCIQNRVTIELMLTKIIGLKEL
jgi:hypothetical protein